jgi:hypothetical protein
MNPLSVSRRERQDKMQTDAEKEQLTSNLLVHLYHSVVIGTLGSTAIMLRMKLHNEPINPRHKDLKGLYDALGPERTRLFYDAVASISEFVVYGMLDFIEQYNMFESEDNRNEYPRLSLVYENVIGNEVIKEQISSFNSDHLGKMFKQIARNDEIRSIVEAKIKSIMDAGPP